MSLRASKRRDIGSILCAVALIGVGIVAYIDTTFMLDSDSYVFPRAVIIALVVFSLLGILKDIVKPSDQQRAPLSGNAWRSVFLVVTMLVSILLIPLIGFLLALQITFVLLMVVAMYERWTTKRLMLYPLMAVVVVLSLYLLFSEVFLVQFP